MFQFVAFREVRPRGLEQAAERLRRAFDPDEEGFESESVIRALRERVIAMVRSAGDSLVLTRRQARVAAWICCEEPEVLPGWNARAIRVLLARRRPPSPHLLYLVYQSNYDQETLRAYLNRELPGRLPAPYLPDSPLLEAFLATDPVASGCAAIDHLRLPLGQIADVSRLDVFRRLFKAIVLRLLTGRHPGWLRLLNRVDVQFAFQLVPGIDDRLSFCESFLVAHFGSLPVAPRKLSEVPEVEALLVRATRADVLGVPKSTSPGRWAGASPALLRTVRTWLTHREVVRFFDDIAADPLRREFWRRAAHCIDEFHYFSDCRAFSMRIGPLWFVEFGDHGNACYVYEETQYRKHASAAARRAGREAASKAALRSARDCFRGHVAVPGASGTLEVRPPLHHRDVGQGRTISWQSQFAYYIAQHCGETLDS